MNLAIKIAAAILSVPPEAIALVLPMMAPPPRNTLEMQVREEVDTVLSGHCCSALGDENDNADTPLFALSKEEIQFVDCQSGMPSFTGENLYQSEDIDDEDAQPSTYGEVTMLGARQLFYHMKLNNKDLKINKPQYQFFDLGSGGGRLVIQAHLELPSVIKSVGIELSPTRHAVAMQNWKGLQITKDADRIRKLAEESWGVTRLDNDALPTVELYEGDLFELDISKATHIYVSSLCFSEEMLDRLITKIEREAVSLQILASLRMLPLGDRWKNQDEWDNEDRKMELGTKPWQEFVEMSWTKATGDGCPVYFYTAKKLK